MQSGIEIMPKKSKAECGTSLNSSAGKGSSSAKSRNAPEAASGPAVFL
jgi:hypothetical protein